ncbi:MFS transporter [Actinorhabdospora filicis]|uniref:MFS transporter n=1 Tax=Actinorhabdospora filicis TaxID=1785913 RepID=A0A9W6SJM0_9ACTN|nr:MFS transporter [Actinorhabdospora filicis]GLZ77203.1 MFS transporter [Actinorhabdospora filicis]
MPLFTLDLRPLRRRDFRLYYTGSAISAFGSMISTVVIPFQVAKMTQSPVLVGLLGLCELVPLLFTSFIGGALADYVDRRRLVLWCEVALTGLTGLLLLNSLVGKPQLWALYVIAALTTALAGLARPSRDSLIPRLVEPHEIPAVSGLQSTYWNVSAIAGPAIAGFMLAHVHLAWVYAIDLATFAVSLACLALVRAVPPPPDADRPSVKSVLEGLRYAKRRPELLGTYLVDMNAMFFGIPTALFPFLALQFGGPQVLGLLHAAPAAGALLASATSGWAGRVHRHGLVVLVAAGIWGLGILGFGLSPNLWPALACLAVAGGADMISGMFRGIIWNQTIPDRLRGRLAGIEQLSYLSGPTLGNLEAGAATKLFGIGGSVIFGGVMTIVGTGALALWLRSFVTYDGREGIARKEKEEAEFTARREATAT